MAPSADTLSLFSPIVRDWFEARLGDPTPPQQMGWPAIASHRDTLIAAPTGSGKTLAAFLVCIDELIRRGLKAPLQEGISILYISPLKALSNDIARNLEQPLAELSEMAARRGMALPSIQVSVRTGDTPASERAKMRKTPPHILVTTPESLFILLTAEKSRSALARVETVIVDEIHAIADDKRGAHLGLSLERLDRLAVASGRSRPTRIGLSATQSPIRRIARFLGGGARSLPTIVDSGFSREVDLAIEITDDELGSVASGEQCGRVYDRIAELVAEHDTSLVFVNTRRMVERVAHALEERLGEEQVVAHHGSLSRKLRFAAEDKLKSGAVKCAVATASLELGIDVGAVDLVVQLGSPRSISTLLQRVGRSGHSLGKTPKGRLFALTRDQLIECAALVRAVRGGRLDEIDLRAWPRDVLAQQMVAICACEDIGETELYELVCRAACYAELPRRDFDDIVSMLADGISTIRGRRGAHLHRDRVSRRLRARRGARLAAITSGGAIPDAAIYPVVTFPEETAVGSLDEDFAIESSPGDVFLLGNTSWRVRRIEAGRVLVEDAHGDPPTVPFWFGEAPARTFELSDEVSRLRMDLAARHEAGDSTTDIAAWLAAEASMSTEAAVQTCDYLAASLHALGALPTRDTIIAERFFDEAGGMQLILHSPLGGRINKAWGLALRKKFCRSFNFELQAAATDDGIIISLGPPHSFPLMTVFDFLRSATAKTTLEQAVLGAPVFGVRWRWNSTRSLAVLRRFGGKKVPPHLLRMRTDDLLSVVFPMQQACLETVVGDIEIPDHPLVNETMDDCLSEFMDVDGLVDLLKAIESGEVRTLAVDTTEPSPLSHEIVNANPYAFLDDVPLEERRTRAVSLPRGLRSSEDAARIVDDGAIDQAAAEFHPPVRDADELHDLLLSLGISCEQPQWAGLFAKLVAAGRATRWWVERQDGDPFCRWVTTERVSLARVVLAGGRPRPEVVDLDPGESDPPLEEALMIIVRGHLEVSRPMTADALAAQVGVGVDAIRAALMGVESQGAILRGSFSASARRRGDVEWADRRVLARIHRLTVGRLRKAVEPVDAAALMRFLFRWQRLEPGAQLMGPDAVETIVEQLQGFESAAGAWEPDLLGRRIIGYEPAVLDQSCLTGRVAWARLSPRVLSSSPDDVQRWTPTRAAPLSLCLRGDLSWLRAPVSVPDSTASDDLVGLTVDVYRILDESGALFLGEIVDKSGAAATDVEEALWQLVCRGLVHADGFTSLRILVGKQRSVRPSPFDESTRRPTLSGGKWARVVNRARTRDSRRSTHAVHSLPTASGRWSRLPPSAVEDVDVEANARQLLHRYGVVFRDLLTRERALPPWRELLSVYRRLEARGEIRGGRFVSGFVGEQFALPEAVSGLRAARHAHGQRPTTVRVAATDPLNLVGITSPGSRVPAVMGNEVLYRDGSPIAAVVSGQVEILASLRPGERVGEQLAYELESAARPEQARLPFQP